MTGKHGGISIRPATALALCVLAVALGVLIVHLTTTADEFGRYNPDWNGTSAFFDSLNRHDVVTIADPSALAGYTNTTLLVVAPDIRFTQNDLNDYRDYVLRGNTLVLADDFSGGNTLLSGIGSAITILPGDLASVDRAYDNPSLVVAYPAGASVLPALNTTIVFDKAAALSGGEPQVSTSLLSWREENNSIAAGQGKVLNRYPVVTREALGKGDLYVISDPSIFINGMHASDDTFANPQFMQRFSGGNRTILIDTYSSRAFHGSGIREIFQEAQTRTDYNVIIAAAILCIIGLAWRRKWI